MLKTLFSWLLVVVVIDSVLGHKKHQHKLSQRRGARKWQNGPIAGSDKDYLWDNDLSSNLILSGNSEEIEFHVSDGNNKIITWNGIFTVNGEVLATDGIWLNKKKFTVYVPKWKGWWVGKLIFNQKDNLRGMKTMFIKSLIKTNEPPQAVRQQQPQHFEKGDLYFKTLTKRNNNNNNWDDDSCQASNEDNGDHHHHHNHHKHHKHHKHGKGGKRGNKKHGKHGKYGKHHKTHHHHHDDDNDSENDDSENEGHWHWHADGKGGGYWHEHKHGDGRRHCCGFIGRLIAIVGGLFIFGSLLLFVFRAVFDDVLTDCCCSISMVKIKLDIENGEFRMVWKNPNNTKDTKDDKKDNDKEKDNKDKKEKEKEKCKNKGKKKSKNKKDKDKKEEIAKKDIICQSDDKSNDKLKDTLKCDNIDDNESGDDMDIEELFTTDGLMVTDNNPSGEVEQ